MCVTVVQWCAPAIESRCQLDRQHTPPVPNSSTYCAMPQEPKAILKLCWVLFFSSRRRHTRYLRDWSSDVCSSDLNPVHALTAADRDDALEVCARNLPANVFVAARLLEGVLTTQPGTILGHRVDGQLRSLC